MPKLRIALYALIALVAIGGALGLRGLGSIQTPATSPTYSTGGSVQLVIDFGSDSGRPTEEMRVASYAGTGWGLFAAAGVAVEGTADYPNSFACRIAEWPSEATENCAGTPNPAVGYWKYFVTNPEIGSGWIASGVGAAGRTLSCGGSDGWLWVTPLTPASAVPSIAPANEIAGSKCH